MNGRATALLVAGLIGLSCATTAQPSVQLSEPQDLSVQGPYKHPSGLELPQSIAGIERERITRYDQQGQDVSAAYTRRGGIYAMVATIYVYPGSTLEQVGSAKEAATASLAHLEEIKGHVLKVEPGARLVTEEQFPMVVKGTEYPALHATLDFDTEWFGAVTPVRSHIYLVTFFGGRWIIKYRFTHPRDQKSDLAMQAFLKEWPGAR